MKLKTLYALLAVGVALVAIGAALLDPALGLIVIGGSIVGFGLYMDVLEDESGQ